MTSVRVGLSLDSVFSAGLLLARLALFTTGPVLALATTVLLLVVIRIVVV